MEAKQLRDQILAADDRQKKTVEVPEWGCSVTVRTMSAADREKIEGAGDDNQWRARLLSVCLCDEQGQPVFTAADVAALAAKSGPVVTRLARVAVELNQIGEANVEAAKNA